MRSWNKIYYSCVLFLSVISRPLFAQGLELNPDDIRGTQSKKTITVLQNRFFLKAWRPEFGILGGSMLNETYTDSVNYGGRIGLFFNEWVGAEAQYIKVRVRDSIDRKVLNRLKYKPIDDPTGNTIVTPDPEVNAISQMIDYNFVAAPFYGKLNFLDLAIVYTDLYGTLGMSRLATDQGDKNAFLFGMGARFYLGERLSFRADVRNRMFDETRADQTSRRKAWSFDLGLSVFLF